MRSALSLLALGLVLALAPALTQAQPSRTVTKNASLRPDDVVVLNTYSGEVEVTPWDRQSVRVEARIEDEDRELVERTKIRVEKSGSMVEIAEEVEESGGGGFLSSLFGDGSDEHPSVYYRIRVPRRARVELNTYSSDVRAQGLAGALTVNSYSGDLSARGLRGGATVDTYSGDADVAFERLGGDVSFNSYSGDATLRLPRGAGFRLEANLGMSGDFESGLGAGAFTQTESGYRGTVGGGGPRLSFNTFSGDLRLERP